MKFNTYFGKKVEGAYEAYLERTKQEKEDPELKTSQIFDVRADIKGEDYIRIPNTNIIIARQEQYKNKDWADTHYALAENGLFMPSPKIFMPYFVQVRDAVQGKIKLYTADNREVPRDEAEELWKYLSTSHKGGCWTWLDAKFSQENNAWKMTHTHKVIQKGKELKGKAETLESCIREDGFVGLDFNSQGLPIKKSSLSKYKQGENIQYWHPRNGTVARFDAESGRVGLSCFWNPRYSNPALGVFSCAEGAQKN
ncbi:hypothetical protein HYV89_00570 [Candidatus Woesearchaeota archaeon]|nr:hypothetical protein [Candidatus Woesearchaeota archaeon]